MLDAEIEARRILIIEHLKQVVEEMNELEEMLKQQIGILQRDHNEKVAKINEEIVEKLQKMREDILPSRDEW